MYLTKRQRQILDYISQYIEERGYAPTLKEIGQALNLSSLATVHKHLRNLEEKGAINRSWNRGRSITLAPAEVEARSLFIPLVGLVAAGQPIEALENVETITVPEDMVGKRRTYALKVRGDSMIDEHIRDGDYVIVEERPTAENGEMVVALLRNQEATLKKFFQEGNIVRLMPANPALKPIQVPAEELQIQGVVIGVIRRYR